MKYCLLFLISALSWGQVSSQSAGRQGKQPPKVVIGFLVENMRPDYISRYWNNFGEDGFKKLWSGGTVCTDFRLEHHIQNYATGTATLFTGVNPSVHGIIDRTWYDRNKERVVSCTEDEKFPVIGAAVRLGTASPRKLMATTLGDRLKLYTNGKAKVYSAGMTDATALISSGMAGDAAFWFDTISGNMVSSSFYMDQLPGWVKEFNGKGLPQKYTARNWAVLKSLSAYTESCEDGSPLEKGYGPGKNIFPHQVGPLVKAAGNYSPLKSTPYANAIVREFAIDLLDNEPVGSDAITDLVTLSFSSMDDENSAFGPASVEMEDIYLRLDQEIAALITYAENKYGKGQVVFFLTANTSSSYPAAWLKEKLRMATGEFSSESVVALLNSYLNITFGDLRWISYNNGLQFYLNRQLIELNKINIKEIRSKAAEFVSRFEGVEAVATADQMEQGEPADQALLSVFRTYNAERSGDVMYLLREGWQPVHKFKKVNYTDQSLVPLVFYGAGIPASVIKTPCDGTSFAPTLAEIMMIPRPEKSRGIILEGF